MSTLGRKCPNPNCAQQFINEQAITTHLATQHSECNDWTTAFIRKYGVTEDASDDEGACTSVSGHRVDAHCFIDDYYLPDLREIEESDNEQEEDEPNRVVPPLASETSASDTSGSFTSCPAGLRKVYHSNKSKSYGSGRNLLQKIDTESLYASQRYDSGNFYYPFGGRDEWKFVEWTVKSSLPQKEIDALLKLKHVSR